jgi:hypothetical protein
MSTKKLLEENFKLSQKLADYIAANPNVSKKFPGNSSFVAFSARNIELNKANCKLVKSLKSEGKKVIKATQGSSKSSPWLFSSAT